MDNQIMTEEQVAQELRCSKQTLRLDRLSGRGCPFFRRGKKVLYQRKSFQVYLDGLEKSARQQEEAKTCT